MSRLMDTITVPMARASILWLLGEYADKVTKIAPDVLRKVAKTFSNEVSMSLRIIPATIKSFERHSCIADTFMHKKK